MFSLASKGRQYTLTMVSIIIPTYGLPSGLKPAIDSILKQTCPDWELIVVDDNEPNTKPRSETEQLMHSYTDKRIVYLQHPHNKNGAAARNTGIAKAKGKYIAFLDSDDEYLPQRLEKCISVMELAPNNVAGVYTGCEFRRGGEVYHVEKTVEPGNFLVQTLACSFRFQTGSNIFVRKSVVDELGGFDESFIRHQDYEFLARVFQKGYDLTAIQEVLVVKNNENVNLPNVEKMIVVKEQYLNKFKTVIDTLSQKEQQYVYHTQYTLVAEAALRTKNRKMAKEYYRKASNISSLTTKEQFRRLVFTIKSFV